MRVLVLSLAIALVAGQNVNLAPEFSAAKTYVYKYEALLLGGLPVDGLAKAGMKVSSKVLISALAENIYLLKVIWTFYCICLRDDYVVLYQYFTTAEGISFSFICV
ncbi:vitellogenin-like, partial [Clupea harengus]|uniref:Vitellogenin-like n=1 Tax=Clupea harengus TaxID=7950 RepID=A0A8M1KET0_CLUHA